MISTLAAPGEAAERIEPAHQLMIERDIGAPSRRHIRNRRRRSSRTRTASRTCSRLLALRMAEIRDRTAGRRAAHGPCCRALAAACMAMSASSSGGRRSMYGGVGDEHSAALR